MGGVVKWEWGRERAPEIGEGGGKGHQSQLVGEGEGHTSQLDREGEGTQESFGREGEWTPRCQLCVGWRERGTGVN